MGKHYEAHRRRDQSDTDPWKKEKNDAAEKKEAQNAALYSSYARSAADSDLAADYVMTFSDFQNKPTNLKFYSDSSFTNETDITASGYSITGTLASGDATTKTIYWKWAYGAASSVTLDNQDADKNVSFTVTVVGTQHEA